MTSGELSKTANNNPEETTILLNKDSLQDEQQKNVLSHEQSTVPLMNHDSEQSLLSTPPSCTDMICYSNINDDENAEGVIAVKVVAEEQDPKTSHGLPTSGEEVMHFSSDLPFDGAYLFAKSIADKDVEYRVFSEIAIRSNASEIKKREINVQFYFAVQGFYHDSEGNASLMLEISQGDVCSNKWLFVFCLHEPENNNTISCVFVKKDWFDSHKAILSSPTIFDTFGLEELMRGDDSLLHMENIDSLIVNEHNGGDLSVHISNITGSLPRDYDTRLPLLKILKGVLYSSFLLNYLSVAKGKRVLVDDNQQMAITSLDPPAEQVKEPKSRGKVNSNRCSKHNSELKNLSMKNNMYGNAFQNMIDSHTGRAKRSSSVTKKPFSIIYNEQLAKEHESALQKREYRKQQEEKKRKAAVVREEHIETTNDNKKPAAKNSRRKPSKPPIKKEPVATSGFSTIANNGTNTTIKVEASSPPVVTTSNLTNIAHQAIPMHSAINTERDTTREIGGGENRSQNLSLEHPQQKRTKFRSKPQRQNNDELKAMIAEQKKYLQSMEKTLTHRMGSLERTVTIRSIDNNDPTRSSYFSTPLIDRHFPTNDNHYSSRQSPYCDNGDQPWRTVPNNQSSNMATPNQASNYLVPHNYHQQPTFQPNYYNNPTYYPPSVPSNCPLQQCSHQSPIMMQHPFMSSCYHQVPSPMHNFEGRRERSFMDYAMMDFIDRGRGRY